MSIFEYKTHIKGLSDKELYSCFRSDNWPNDIGERCALAQEVENRIAKEQGREPATVRSYKSCDNYGEYESNSNKIYIDMRDKNSSYHVLDTTIHEGRHAFQDFCVENKIGQPNGLDDSTRAMCQVENARITKDNLHNGESTYYIDSLDKNGEIHSKEYKFKSGDFYNYKKTVSYENCVCEADCRIEAVERIMQNGDSFRGDPEYTRYLEKTMDRLDSIGNLDRSTIRIQQGLAVDNCLDRKDISINDYDNIKLNYINKGLTTSRFDDAKNLHDQIQLERLKSAYETANPTQLSESESFIKKRVYGNNEGPKDNPINNTIDEHSKHQKDFFQTEVSNQTTNKHSEDVSNWLDTNENISLDKQEGMEEKHEKFFADNDEEQNTETKSQEQVNDSQNKNINLIQ